MEWTGTILYTLPSPLLVLGRRGQLEVIDDIAAQAETHSLLLQAFLNPDFPSIHDIALLCILD